MNLLTYLKKRIFGKKLFSRRVDYKRVRVKIIKIKIDTDDKVLEKDVELKTLNLDEDADLKDLFIKGTTSNDIAFKEVL